MKISNILTLGDDVKTKLFLFLLCLMFIDYAGYGYYVFYLPFIYLVFHKGYKIIDKNFLVLLLWGMSYGLTNWVNTGTLSYGSVLLYMINMPILYLMGKYLACHNKRSSLVSILFILILALAGISLLSVLKDISLNGFSGIGVERNIPLIGISNYESYTAATGISSRLIPLAFFYVLFLCPYEKNHKIIVVSFSILAIFCLMRIQSRTSVVGCVIVLIGIVLLTWKSRSLRQRVLLLLGLLIVLGIVGYVLNHFSDQLSIIDRFQNESVETGGGRLELKAIVIDNMIDYPFGGMGKEIRYAHDLWFDCTRVAGIFPFILLIFITITYLKDLYTFLKSKELWILRVSMGIVSFALFIVFAAEPILEGIPMCFALFCLIFGMLSILKNKCYIKNTFG